MLQLELSWSRLQGVGRDVDGVAMKSEQMRTVLVTCISVLVEFAIDFRFGWLNEEMEAPTLVMSCIAINLLQESIFRDSEFFSPHSLPFLENVPLGKIKRVQLIPYLSWPGFTCNHIHCPLQRFSPLS